MNRLSTAKRAQVIAALVEGNSINATCRMLGVGKHTVLRLLEDAGCACAAYHYRNVRGLKVRRLQCDEIWAFVGAAFGGGADYAMLHKIYGAWNEPDHRYSPATCIGCDMKTVSGVPDPDHVSTSYVERQNLTMRMSMRRFTRLTNAFSKKLENHAAMVALYFMYYNFGRMHQTLRVTPAMEAGITDHVWSIEEIVGLLG